ncbi:DUF3253 domain-containing protein [Brevundimonas sp. NIBR11]|uniref:DUF3253 domain-containing protein n=1 Tax=Brevundimonas sp. NIBR11 TaxID=3015999 RepID=UPI0022F0627C|nr:DUF3253 domain-containing protein [Brevundimonas sp. NIBR11]
MSPKAQVLALLDARAEGATVCPSEAARALAGEDGDWRARMPEVRAAVDQLTAEGRVRLSWKGRPMSSRAGAYRIGRASALRP